MNYDSAYHKLFSNPKMVEDLFLNFVDEEWVADLDFSTLQRISAKFHTQGLKRREGDMVFRVNLYSGDEAYLYLMLEFQSRSDPWMALRVLIYASLLYDQLYREKRLKPGSLPPVFPVVLYNGDHHWKAPTKMSQLIDLKGRPKLKKYQPLIEYYMIDESRFTQLNSHSLSGILFNFEQQRNPTDIKETWQNLFLLLKTPGYDSIGRDFLSYLRHVLEPKMQIELDFIETLPIDKVEPMLKTNVEKWEQAWLQQGIELGLQKGKAQTLCNLLEKRFGPLSEQATHKIQDATMSELEAWSLKVFDVDTLDDIFK